MKAKHKKRIVITTILICSIFGSLLYLSYDYYKFAEGVMNDTQRIFDKKKEFIHRLGFQGQVREKKFCEECALNKYTLKIDVFQLSEKPDFMMEQYPPNYEIYPDTVLIITVPKQLFDQVTERDTVIKDRNSNNLKIRKQEYLYLNKGSNQWLP